MSVAKFPAGKQIWRLALWATVLQVCSLLAGTLQAAIINVPADFPTIQEAIEAAHSGDEIVVQPGVYQEQVNTLGKAITIRSTVPEDAAIVASTVIDAVNAGTTIEIIFGEAPTTVIDGFTITGGNSDFGGGIAIFASDPTIRRCVFDSNAAGSGGGAYLLSSSAWFDRCLFWENAADRGGAIYNYASNLPRFIGCEVRGNVAHERGGGVATDFGAGRYDGCLFVENQAGERGGALWGTNSVPLIVSSVIRDNSALRGGALYTDDTSPRIFNSTIVQNVAEIGSGGFIDGIFSQPIIRNSIIRENGVQPVDGFSVNPAVEYSNFQGGASGAGNIDADPLFIDGTANNFRLVIGSPSIDTGLSGWVASFSLDDRDGTPRIQDGIVDMGAFENPGFVPPPASQRGDLVVGLKDDSNLAFGWPLPLISYDPESGEWIELVRNLPAFAVSTDVPRKCFWVHNGETGMLNRVPFATLRPEEIGVLRLGSSAPLSISGLAVRNGILFASTGPFSSQGVYTIDTSTARATLVTEIDGLYDVWDLAFHPSTNRMLFLSSAGELPGDPLGIFEIDLDTFEINQVQQWVNDDPFNQAPALQGLAVGDNKTFLFRSLYNDLEVYDSDTLQLVDELQLPDSVPGNGWVLGGLSWAGSVDAKRIVARRTRFSFSEGK